MKETIVSNLRKIEQTQQVKILYACETGSRAWGLASDSSDYDVRFIYVHPRDHYLSIDPIGTGKKRDVIEWQSQEMLDISGWELSKTLRLYRKSNPSLLEWLHSPIPYYQAYSTVDTMKKKSSDIVDFKSCMLHYVNTSKANYYKFLKANQKDIKTLINIIRPLLAAMWIEHFKAFPPLDFRKLVNTFIPHGELSRTISKLIDMKISGNYEHFQTSIILKYAFDEIKRIEHQAKLLDKRDMNITETLNDLFRVTLSEIWDSN